MTVSESIGPPKPSSTSHVPPSARTASVISFKRKEYGGGTISGSVR